MNNQASLTSIKIINAIGFQIGWFICILMGSIESILFTLSFSLLHLTLIRKQSSVFSLPLEISWLILFFVFGLIIEIILFNTGILYFEHNNSTDTFFIFPPIWIICLWLLFATAMRTSLTFLFHSKLIGFILIMVATPVSYFAGAALNSDVNLMQPYYISLTTISLIWGGFMILLLNLKHHYFARIFHDW